MPEGDTVSVAAARLHGALTGARIERSDLRVPAFATVDLSGQTVRAVAARGKHILLRTDGDLTVHSHFGMDGRWDLVRSGQRVGGRQHEIRCVLETEPWTAIGRRLAVLEVLPSAREGDVLGHLGPDVLGDDWDPGEALRRLAARPDRSIGEAMIDQRVMAGPGNIYRSEVCFLRGLDPATPVGAVPDLAGVIDMTKRLMEANRTTGAQITTGDLRRGRGQWVYGRAGRPCLRCGTTIVRATMGGPEGERVIFRCPSCQPAPGRS